ncbi:MAG TPA: tRNA (adenosine(37)-N6)-threonylcarbamoyltransferase complex dimerization subunit type 1 TsaB [Vicinamibacterales bacterium]|nr:tRNA (adenosine(37)-N6)-threonylcarbamoyltransferase complex dimerization subunit type 1 TsaB [Vicinamibacterales bacterium]
MLVLALDTTTRAGSIAVVDDTGVRSTIVGDASITHGARLPSDLRRALDEAGVAVPAIDLLAVAAGPGSFTGLRVGISAMQGLAMATSRSIVPVSALDALAIAGANDRAAIGAWMDAQRGEVFAALYDPSGTGVVIAASSLSPASTLDAWQEIVRGRDVRFVGDGAVRYHDVIRERFGHSVDVLEPPPLAPILGRIALAAPDRAVTPHAVVPIYIRRPDAELAKAGRRA